MGKQWPFFLLLGFIQSARAAEGDVEALIRNGHWLRARAFAEDAYKDHPRDPHTIYVLARVRRAFQSYDEAERLAEQAVRIEPKADVYHRLLGEVLADQIQKPAVFKQLSLARRMRAEFETALALAPSRVENQLDEIDYLINAPAIAGGDKRKALAMAQDISSSDLAGGYLALAKVARAQKEENKLESLYQKAVTADPRSYEARITLGAFYSAAPLEDPTLCEQHARIALELNPDRIAAYRLLAYALAAQKRLDEADRLLARAVAAIPDDLSPCVTAGRVLLRENVGLAQAESYLRRYITETKEPEAGAPHLAGVHWSLGLVYEKQRRLTDARKELQTALRLKPDFEPAKRDLKRLQ